MSVEQYLSRFQLGGTKGKGGQGQKLLVLQPPQRRVVTTRSRSQRVEGEGGEEEESETMMPVGGADSGNKRARRL